MTPVYRSELKFAVSYADRELLLHRLSAALTPDPHGQNGVYSVRSLYFDTPQDDALQDALAGNLHKVKFRLRMYDGEDRAILFEKKVKKGAVGYKDGTWIGRDDCLRLLRGDFECLRDRNEPFLQECYARGRSGELQPRSVVQYTRAAFGWLKEEVRVTVDSNIRVSSFTDLFLDPALGGAPVTAEDHCVLEVKFNRFLPDFIPRLVGIGDRELQAFSKYAFGRTSY